MTTTVHNPIDTGAPANASTFNTPLGQLDAAIAGLKDGSAPFKKLNVGTDTTLTISGDIIAVTRTRHLIDTEGASAQDNLVTINGGVEGDIIILQSVSASRVIVIKNSGNIYPTDGAEVTLDNPYQVFSAVFDGTKWCELSPSVALKLSTYNNLVIPEFPFAVEPALWARNRFAARAAAATIVPDGIASPTLSGSSVASNDTDSAYTLVTSGAVLGNIAGYVSASFNLMKRQHNPVFHTVIRTGASIANMRFWIGLFSAAPTNADTLALHMVAFRFSTVAGDAGWMPMTAGGGTNTLGTAMDAVAAATRYLLSIDVRDAASQVLFRVNGGAPQVLTTNLPTNTQDLGFAVYAITNEAVAKTIKFSRLAVEMD
jgi:hypothetical protein